MKVEDLKFDERNYRKHDDRNKKLIKKSIDECGLGRSVVVDSENCLIGGNGVVSQVDKDTPVRVIETDGSELVVVKRTDLKTDDEKRKRLAVLDNSTTDSSIFDIDLLKEDFGIPELDDLGVEIPVIQLQEEEEEPKEKGINISYEIIFNDEEEQRIWYDWIKSLKEKYPDMDTISERIIEEIQVWLV